MSQTAVLTGHFDRVQISSSAVLRINFIRAERASHARSDTDGTAAVYTKLSVAQNSSQGETNSGGAWRNWLPEVTLTCEIDKYAESDALNLHSADTEFHLSTAEHAALSELLANKEALLALLNN